MASNKFCGKDNLPIYKNQMVYFDDEGFNIHQPCRVVTVTEEDNRRNVLVELPKGWKGVLSNGSYYIEGWLPSDNHHAQQFDVHNDRLYWWVRHNEIIHVKFNVFEVE